MNINIILLLIDYNYKSLFIKEKRKNLKVYCSKYLLYVFQNSILPTLLNSLGVLLKRNFRLNIL